jgi:arginine decarboxylase
MLGLAEKASIEILYWRIARAIQTKFSQESGQAYPEGLAELDEQLTDQHICNFSLFQSLLDHWALGQIFPVVPIHRLNEKPENRSALVDITCDSDGRGSRFLGRLGVTPNLPLHHFGKDPYYLGIFLVGAYQDIMGDIHNLFGRENEVHIYSSSEAPNGFKVENQISATTLAEVLEMTEYAPDDLIERMRLQVQDAIKSRKIDQVEGTALLQGYMKGFEGQTYLDLKAD